MTASGRVAVVTGAGRRTGIGRAIAERLLGDGHTVVVTDLGDRPGVSPWDVVDGSELALTVEALGAAGDVACLVCDVRDEDEVDAMVAQVVQRYGRLDVLVNNAGLAAGLKPVTELTLAEWQVNLDVMATGVFLCSRAVARHMITAGTRGRIVTIASQAGKTGFACLAAYSAAKFAAVGFTQALALELGPHGITVNAVCPGTIDTPMNDQAGGMFDVYAGRAGLEKDDYKRRILRHIPLQRFGRPDDVAAAVAYLVSDDAAFVTGAALNVTGGQEVH